ncbi:MAG: DegV family protein [Ktedonobacterales bacterium]|nr:DegV family protein [Ktedonobacterales bacterium]
MTVHVVTDSTSDIDHARATQLGITIVPLIVDFSGQTYRDGVDMDNHTFYQRLATAAQMPKTSTPDVGTFRDTYEQVIKDGATGIVSVHISGALSGTLNAATLAANQLTEDRQRARQPAVPIRLIDSRTVSAGFGYPVILAAERARNGDSLDAVGDYVQRLADSSKTYFLLDTLEYLQKGGRISAIQAGVGAMLSIKPILGIRDGIVVSLERVRTRSKALARMGELVAAGNVESLALAASDDGAAEDLLKVVRPVYDGHIEQFRLGAVIGTYAGPHAAGLFVIPKH